MISWSYCTGDVSLSGTTVMNSGTLDYSILVFAGTSLSIKWYFFPTPPMNVSASIPNAGTNTVTLVSEVLGSLLEM